MSQVNDFPEVPFCRDQFDPISQVAACIPAATRRDRSWEILDDVSTNSEWFEILAVSIDSTGREAVAPFMRKLKLTFPLLLDPDGNIKSFYGVTGVPESFIVDKKGILVKKIVGPIDWSTPKIFRFFRDLIQLPKS